MQPTFSVVTIVKDRVPQLANLIASIEQSSYQPSEVIVVWMRPPCKASLLTSTRFTLIHKFVSGETLPIAKARNRGITACSTSTVVYVDVDCLVAPTLFEHMLAVCKPGALVSTPVAYLPCVPTQVNYADLARQASPAGLGAPTGRSFSTRAFAMQLDDFQAVGGFDEQYIGYGVSDADFATRCEQHKLTFLLVPQGVLHQYHERFDPPVNHLFDIVNNAASYRARWGSYPMQHHLEKFAQAGWINADFSETGLRICRVPTAKEMQQFVSTAVC